MSMAQQRRNQISEYLPQRREGRKVRSFAMRAIRKVTIIFLKLGAFAPWREEFPNLNAVRSESFAQAAQI
jgi:hypothetical protein